MTQTSENLSLDRTVEIADLVSELEASKILSSGEMVLLQQSGPSSALNTDRDSIYTADTPLTDPELEIS